MIQHMINPVIVQFGFVQIRYYSLFYIFGLIIGYYIIRHLAKQKKIKLSDQLLSDYIVYLAMGLLVGGRIFYFLFYDTKALFTDPLEIFKLWHGGMSFHGGFVGAAAAGYWFCKKNKLDFWQMADFTAIPLALGLAFGRLGNFINGELWGRPYNGPFCIDYSQNPYINGPEGCRFPSQIIESIKNLLIFTTLWLLRNKNLPKGFLFWLFVTMYGILRFLVEFVREPDAQLGFIIGPFSMGQLLSSVMIIAGGVMLYRLKKSV